MQHEQTDKDYFIFVEKNEKVMETITKFCNCLNDRF